MFNIGPEIIPGSAEYHMTKNTFENFKIIVKKNHQILLEKSAKLQRSAYGVKWQFFIFSILFNIGTEIIPGSAEYHMTKNTFENFKIIIKKDHQILLEKS